ncbi:MAG TPA: GNAT family N-acetyltransferase [Bryobacteraceae bacterium]|jgi:CelD/BcsL family acetyltransferase involved in cellulose biosynthesis
MLAAPQRTPRGSRSEDAALGIAPGVEYVTASEFALMREEWNELLSSSGSDCLFLTWEWLYTWWKSLAEDRHLSIMTVRTGRDPSAEWQSELNPGLAPAISPAREGGVELRDRLRTGSRLIALAPFCLDSKAASRGRFLPEASFLGAGFVGSDYLDIIVRAGYETVAMEALTLELAQKRWSIRWTNMSRSRASAYRAAAGLQTRGWRAVDTTINVCPYISLAGETWESYLASLGAEHRYSFNRKWKRLNREFNVRFERAQTPQESRDSLALGIALHNARWRERGGSDAFHTHELIAFHREFSQLALRRGWLRLYTLRLNEAPVASIYGFLYRGKFYFYQSGFDPVFDKYSVGLVAMGLAIQAAIQEGAEEYDLLHGDEAYKRHWAREIRPLSRLELYPPVFGGWWRYLSRKAVRALRRRRFA